MKFYYDNVLLRTSKTRNYKYAVVINYEGHKHITWDKENGYYTKDVTEKAYEVIGCSETLENAIKKADSEVSRRRNSLNKYPYPTKELNDLAYAQLKLIKVVELEQR